MVFKEQKRLNSRFISAEKEGFEPPVHCCTTVFKTAAFDRSAISPLQRYKFFIPSKSFGKYFLFYHKTQDYQQDKTSHFHISNDKTSHLTRQQTKKYHKMNKKCIKNIIFLGQKYN